MEILRQQIIEDLKKHIGKWEGPPLFVEPEGMKLTFKGVTITTGLKLK